jgi:hypothetical protein
MISCARCALPQLPNTLFCDDCGQEMKASAAKIKPKKLRLRCELLDSHNFMIVPERTPLLIGRTDRKSNTLPDIDLGPVGGREGGISRRHAYLIRHEDALYLEDLGSMNGTFVNHKALQPHRRTRIQPGDLIRIGLMQVIFCFETNLLI